MSISASGSMNCNGFVTVVIVNNTAARFEGRSSTSSSWNMAVNLDPGQSTSISGDFGQDHEVDGLILGTSAEGSVHSPWSAVRPTACGPVPTHAPQPVDTTPRPVPTSAPGDVQMCIQPGSIPPAEVPCSDPRATTAYTVPTTSTSAPVDQPVDSVVSMKAPSTDTDTARPVSRTAPRVVARVAVKTTTAHTVAATQLPTTGAGEITAGAGIGGLLALVVGVILVTVRRRGVSKQSC
jgi:LPXTG-motif cell wall-anchored protein